jgi:hypothetical protein
MMESRARVQKTKISVCLLNKWPCMPKGRGKEIVRFSNYDYDRLDGVSHFAGYNSYTHFS